MKTAISELVDTLRSIENVSTELRDIAVKPSTTEQESDTCNEARDLLDEFKKMILRTKVEI